MRSFLRHVCDPVYGWDCECEARFGTPPVQIRHDWNTAVHTAGFDAEPRRRAMTRSELQLLFDAADDTVVEAARWGRKGFATAWWNRRRLKKATSTR